MKRSNRLAWIGAIALAVIILVSFVAAPTNNKVNSGSTYNRAPDGYGAWYAFMQQQGMTIKRWQKPFGELEAEKPPVTLLQVNSSLREPALDIKERKWVKSGNTLVVLGVSQRVRAANFSTMQTSPFGDVKIETRRRNATAGEEVSLGDRFGAIVWTEKYGKGQVIFSTTPHLAANAYQDYLSNFKYLSDIVSKKGNLLLVDEYIHGYKDASVRKSEGEGDLVSYFAKTPLFPALVQAGVLLLVLIWAQNRRFGNLVALNTPVIDNSEAYIQALAGVLQKADSSEFVVEMLDKEERMQLQQALGLGLVPVKDQNLIDAWVQQTGTSATELNAVLRVKSRKRRMSERDLISWLEKWQTVRHKLPISNQ